MDIKTISDIAESVMKVAAIIVGAGWTYWKFVIQRANEPATDLDISVNFVGKHDQAGSRVLIQVLGAHRHGADDKHGAAEF